MIDLSNIKKPVGFKKKKKRVGRGHGCHGTFSGRGCKGALARSGSSRKWGYEGGQMPLHRRLPKRGFLNIFKKEYRILNLSDLNRLFNDNEIVDEKTLIEKGIIDKNEKVKILSEGELFKKLEVNVEKISKKAAEKIKSVGGKVIIKKSIKKRIKNNKKKKAGSK
ncbi:MAG TPA: 50S ribosomal protein L15 [bacterium]|nr:50S ribosomal protein L15 [bacterium]